MVDKRLDVDPSDSRHMFWEEMKRLFFAMREIEPGSWMTRRWRISFKAMDEVSNVLQRIEKKRKERRGGGKQEKGDRMARIFN